MHPINLNHTLQLQWIGQASQDHFVNENNSFLSMACLKPLFQILQKYHHFRLSLICNKAKLKCLNGTFQSSACIHSPLINQYRLLVYWNCLTLFLVHFEWLQILYPILCKMEARLSLTVILIWASGTKVSSMKDQIFFTQFVPSIRVLR